MNTKKTLLLVPALLAAAMLLGACNLRTIRGSGDVISETRPVSNFDQVALSGSGQLIITQGSGEFLTIETDDNVMEHIEAEVVGGTLRLGFVNGINIISTTRLVFYVGLDEINGLSVSGSGDVEADRIESDRLEIEVSGSGEVRIADLAAGDVNADISGSGEISLDGQADSQSIQISGSGKYLAGNVCSNRVEVGVSGSGDTTVCALETLIADVSGSGSISYYGQPAVDFSGSGSGNIQSLGE